MAVRISAPIVAYWTDKSNCGMGSGAALACGCVLIGSFARPLVYASARRCGFAAWVDIMPAEERPAARTWRATAPKRWAEERGDRERGADGGVCRANKVEC